MMEELMHPITHKTTKKDKLINNLQEKEISAQTFAKFKKIMEQGNFSGNSNELNLCFNIIKFDFTLIFQF